MKEMFQSIRRSPYQSLASFMILFFTVLTSLFFFNLTSFFYGYLSYVETKPEVTVFFQKQTSQDEIFKIRDALASSGKTLNISYTSQKDALKSYREDNKNDPLLLEMVSAENLPASLDINAKKPEFLTEIASFLEKQKGVNEVAFQKDSVDNLIMITNISRRLSMFIFIFLIILSFVVLMTTTALKIALKKGEIELLRLLGADKLYVRKPYLLEGLFFGFVASTSAFLVFYLALFYFFPFLNWMLTGVPNIAFYHLSNLGLYVWPPNLNFILLTYLITLIFGTILGFIGNLIATSKYIK